MSQKTICFEVVKGNEVIEQAEFPVHEDALFDDNRLGDLSCQFLFREVEELLRKHPHSKVKVALGGTW